MGKAGTLATIVSLGATLAACAVSYTDADLREQENRREAERAEREAQGRLTEEAGGTNAELLDAAEEQLDREINR